VSDWVYATLTSPFVVVLAFLLRSIAAIPLPRLAYSRSLIVLMVTLLSIGNYALAGTIPLWITGSHNTLF
jgi:hypothetical protein